MYTMIGNSVACAKAFENGEVRSLVRVTEMMGKPIIKGGYNVVSAVFGALSEIDFSDMSKWTLMMSQNADYYTCLEVLDV